MSSRSVLSKALLAAGVTWLGIEAVQRLREDDLRGEVALVTGGSRGLGFLLAQELGRNGCRVAICARDWQELEAAWADLTSEGIEVYPIVCDVADQAAVEEMVTRVTRHYGRIDILVNNAGIIQVGSVQNMTVADFQRAMDIIFWGTLYPTRAVLPQMLARRCGRIVNITSIGGKVSVPHLLPYSAAKFAATGFSEGLTAELRSQGIYVTTVAPSTLRTGSHLQAQFAGQHDKEYAWFGLSATLPLVSTDAEQAAREIVQATKRRAAFHYVGWPAQLAARVHGLFPGFMTELFALVIAYAMPAPTARPTAIRRGMEVEQHLPRTQRRVLETLMTLGQQAAQHYHQYAGEPFDDHAPLWPERNRQ
ncbi:MAG: SDR family NAD(P)-dependent oxidoreductase [Caldilineaceae bacterium]